MNRDDAIAFACGALCLQVHTVLPLAMQSASVAVGTVENTDVVTWLAKGTRFLTLVQTPRGTRVYDHTDDLLYFANPNTELPKGFFPEGHALLCQTVCDRQPNGLPPVPRLLVMDLLVSPPIECPRQRGEALRKLAHHLPHTCHLQWAGDKQALQASSRRSRTTSRPSSPSAGRSSSSGSALSRASPCSTGSISRCDAGIRAPPSPAPPE